MAAVMVQCGSGVGGVRPEDGSLSPGGGEVGRMCEDVIVLGVQPPGAAARLPAR